MPPFVDGHGPNCAHGLTSPSPEHSVESETFRECLYEILGTDATTMNRIVEPRPRPSFLCTLYHVGRDAVELVRCALLRERMAQVEKGHRLLEHLGIVMDGNRRYATHNLTSSGKGHESGSRKLQDVICWSRNCGIRNLTVWAFSTDKQLQTVCGGAARTL